MQALTTAYRRNTHFRAGCRVPCLLLFASMPTSKLVGMAPTIRPNTPSRQILKG